MAILKVRDQKPGEICEYSNGQLSDGAMEVLLNTLVKECSFGDRLVLMSVEVKITAYAVVPPETVTVADTKTVDP